MKALTLTESINKNIKNDPEFAMLYAKEVAINKIAALIVSLRKENGLTQDELAKKIGTKQSTIARLESGAGSAVPSLDTLLKITYALNYEMDISIHPAVFSSKGKNIKKKGNKKKVEMSKHANRSV